MSEADSPKTTFIFLFVIASLFVLGGLIVAVDQFFNLSVRDEISRKVLQAENTELRKLRAEEEAKLTRYQWVDQKAGVVRIPVDRAMELVRSEWATRPEGPTDSTGANPVPANAPAPAPAGKPAKPAGGAK